MDKQSPIYQRALDEANRVYGRHSSIYRSGYIVQQYKKMGGRMASPRKTSPRKGLQRWFKEEWIQVVPYLTHGKVVACGRSVTQSPKRSAKRSTKRSPKRSVTRSARRLPACRPLHRITDDTPITVAELVALHGKKNVLLAAQRKERSPAKRMNWRTGKAS